MTLAATAHNVLLTLWVAFSLVALAGIIAVIVWAVRSGQFANQDHARYLPLESGIPAEEDRTQEKEEASDASL